MSDFIPEILLVYLDDILAKIREGITETQRTRFKIKFKEVQIL